MASSLTLKQEIHTPYLAAAQVKDFSKILALYEKQVAEIDATSSDGTSAIWMAAAKGYTDIVKLLARLGANVNQCNALGYSPVMMAVHNNHLKTVKRLFLDGAHVNKLNSEGQSCLFIAAKRGHVEMIKLLRQLGGNIDLPSRKDGVCPLLAAVQGRHKQAVRMLYRMGAQKGVTSSKGYLVFPQSLQATHGSVTDAVFFSDVLREVTRRCDLCHMTSPKALGTCRRCERVHYCSRECQRKAHATHKKECVHNNYFFL